MDVSDFLRFWAWTTVVITVCILFKPEKEPPPDSKGVIDTYKLLYDVIKNDAMKSWIPIILTSKVAFAAVDAASSLKFLDAGLPELTLTTASIPLPVVQIMLPVFIAWSHIIIVPFILTNSYNEIILVQRL